MPHSFGLSITLKGLRLAVVPAAILGWAMAAPVAAETVLPVAAFRSVTLTGGGRVILRHAPAQRVALLEGTTSRTRTTIEDSDRLVIDGDCGNGHDMVVEILTPEIEEVRVANGGLIESRGDFPRQAELGVAVEDGGMIDLRSMTADAVAAAVHDGGGIWIKPQKTLAAKVVQGGGITYWGNPRVTSSVQHGGFVVRGKAADADRPLRELGLAVMPAPPVPPVPPVPSVRGR